MEQKVSEEMEKAFYIRVNLPPLLPLPARSQWTLPLAQGLAILPDGSARRVYVTETRARTSARIILSQSATSTSKGDWSTHPWTNSLSSETLISSQLGLERLMWIFLSMDLRTAEWIFCPEAGTTMETGLSTLGW